MKPSGQRDLPFARVPPSVCISSRKILETQLLCIDYTGRVGSSVSMNELVEEE